MKEIRELSGIKSWAEDDRPREKFLNKGRRSLSDAELIAILLGSGTKEHSALDLAKEILRSYDNELHKLGRAGVDELTRLKGVGAAKAVSVLASLELGRRRKDVERPNEIRISSSRDVFELMQKEFIDLDHEEFHVLLLSRSHRVKSRVRISQGGVSGTVVDQRLIFKPAIEKLASAIILCHNHPSGNLQPSEQDKRLTKKVIQSGNFLDIPVLDHVIFTDSVYFSFADEGLV